MARPAGSAAPRGFGARSTRTSKLIERVGRGEICRSQANCCPHSIVRWRLGSQDVEGRGRVFREVAFYANLSSLDIRFLQGGVTFCLPCSADGCGLSIEYPHFA
jgi:hypothetical protein